MRTNSIVGQAFPPANLTSGGAEKRPDESGHCTQECVRRARVRARTRQCASHGAVDLRRARSRRLLHGQHRPRRDRAHLHRTRRDPRLLPRHRGRGPGRRRNPLERRLHRQTPDQARRFLRRLPISQRRGACRFHPRGRQAGREHHPARAPHAPDRGPRRRSRSGHGSYLRHRSPARQPGSGSRRRPFCRSGSDFFAPRRVSSGDRGITFGERRHSRTVLRHLRPCFGQLRSGPIAFHPPQRAD